MQSKSTIIGPRPVYTDAWRINEANRLDAKADTISNEAAFYAERCFKAGLRPSKSRLRSLASVTRKLRAEAFRLRLARYR